MDGASYVELRPAQGGAYLRVGRRVERSAYVRMSGEWALARGGARLGYSRKSSDGNEGGGRRYWMQSKRDEGASGWEAMRA